MIIQKHQPVADTRSPRAIVLSESQMKWQRPGRQRKSLAAINRGLELDRADVLQRAEANTIALTGQARF